MATRKKIPADVATIKSLVQKQAISLASLNKELETAKAEAKRYEEYWRNSTKENNEIKTLVEEVHTLIDACPNAIPRWTKVPKRNEWENEKERENSIMVRLASFMGARQS